jgi:hypothetical protein
MSAIGRRLTFSEESFVRPGTKEVIGFGCALEGFLDVEKLSQAYAVLRREYPILTTRVQADGDGFVFVLQDPDVGEASSVRVRQGAWEFDEYVLSDLDVAQMLSALDITSAADRHRVILWASHAVTEGKSAELLFRRLFSLYSEIVQTGDARPREATPFPEPPHEVMARQGFVARGEPLYEERCAGISWCGSLPSAEELAASEWPSLLFNRLRLDSAASTSLRHKARELGLSVHGLVTAAIALAERQAFTDAPDDEEIHLGLLTPVDFKARLTPPVGPFDITTLTGFSFARVGVTTGSDLVGVAQQVSRQIREDIESGLVQLTAISPIPDWASIGSHTPLLISNMGVLADLELPPELVGLDTRFFIHKDMSGLPALLESDFASMLAPASMYLVSSYGGRLSVEVRNMPGTISRENQENILARIRTLLLGVVAKQQSASSEE